MARSKRVPKLCHHRSTGRGYAREPGNQKFVYFGPWGLKETLDNYHRWAAQFQGPQETTPPAGDKKATILELIKRYSRWALQYYRERGTNRNTSEIHCIRQALVEMRPWFSLPCDSFRPSDLIGVRSAACARRIKPHSIRRTVPGAKPLDNLKEVPGQPPTKKLKLGTINAIVKRIRRMFRKGVEWELVSAATYQALACVAHLSWRDSPDLEESTRILPVDFAHVEAAFPFLSEKFRVMLRVHMATGMRVTELCAMRWGEISQVEPGLWVYEPAKHKTAHRGQAKQIFLGQGIMDLLKKLSGRYQRAGDDFIFLSWGVARAKGYRGPIHADGYRQAIERAQRRLNKQRQKEGKKEIPKWNLLQIRHTVGTLVRRHHGLEASQAVLGHTTLETTQIYAEKRMDLAMQVARTANLIGARIGSFPTNPGFAEIPAQA